MLTNSDLSQTTASDLKKLVGEGRAALERIFPDWTESNSTVLEGLATVSGQLNMFIEAMTPIFESKFQYFVQPHDVGKTIIDYKGTTHNYVELIYNFGLIGMIFFIYLSLFLLNYLKNFRNIGYMYVGLLPNFAFFFIRSFNDTIIKHIIEFSILLPLIIISISYIDKKYSLTEKILNKVRYFGINTISIILF